MIDVLIAFSDPDGTPGAFARTDALGRAAVFVPDHSALTVVDEPNLLTVIDVRPGDRIVLRPPDDPASDLLTLLPPQPFPGADRYQASVGCGTQTLPVGNQANPGRLWSCDPSSSSKVFATAAATDGPLLATALAQGSTRDPIALPAWNDQLDTYLLDLTGSLGAPEEARWRHAVRHEGRWYDLNARRIDAVGARLVAAGPPGFAEAVELRTMVRWGAAEVLRVERWAVPGDDHQLAAETLRPAIDGRFDPDTERLTVTHLRDVPDAVALGARLWFYTDERDEPYARWDLVAPPDLQAWTLLDMPGAIPASAERSFVTGHVRLWAGTQLSTRDYRNDHAGYDLDWGPDPLATDDDEVVWTVFTDEELRR